MRFIPSYSKRAESQWESSPASTGQLSQKGEIKELNKRPTNRNYFNPTELAFLWGERLQAISSIKVRGAHRQLTKNSSRFSFTFTQIATSTFLVLFGVGLIPFHLIVGSDYNQAILDRAVTALLIILAIKCFYPTTLTRFSLRTPKRRLIAGLLLILYFTGFDVVSVGFWNFQLIEVLLAVGFALSIGLVEEIFSRGFIYASLEKYGVQVAAIVSSVHFGLLHLGNIFWGGQAVSYTLAQVIYAAAFGYLATGLMLFTGNIWLSILLHGLINTPMQFLNKNDYSEIVTGTPHWLGMANVSITYLVLGWILIQMSRVNWRGRLQKIAKEWKLIEGLESEY
jgi:membrane protease YdiL (CAAX protease family)